MKILILGHGRHGKDTLAEILNSEFNLTYSSSSEFMLPILFNTLQFHFGYKTLEEAYNDRLNQRETWYNLICEYNSPDKSRLSKGILNDYDAYVGMRDDEEFYASKDLYDLIIWVDASKRIKTDDTTMKIDRKYADLIIDNNDTEEEFKEKVIRIFKGMRQ